MMQCCKHLNTTWYTDKLCVLGVITISTIPYQVRFSCGECLDHHHSVHLCAENALTKYIQPGIAWNGLKKEQVYAEIAFNRARNGVQRSITSKRRQLQRNRPGSSKI